MKLGRIVPVDIRTVWQKEAGDFTPWLAEEENLAALGEALHLGELSLQSTELRVGDFSADIVAVDEGGVQVLVENQLEPTDHRHLGQVLTYLAGIGSNEASVVWVSARFREEHRAAIDWLNRSTIEGYDFFAVEIEVIRIGDSAPAPRFNVVAMPNDWARQARQAVRSASSEAPSETGALYQQYWLALREPYQAEGEKGCFPKAWPRQWLPFRIGRSGFQLAAVANKSERVIRVELYMRQKGMPAKQAFNTLLEQRAEIEAAFGGPLDWQLLPERVASRIVIHLADADVTDRSDWPRQHSWIVKQLSRFRQVFTERVKALRLDEAPGIDASQGELEELG
jgi:hypothetical protein